MSTCGLAVIKCLGPGRFGQHQFLATCVKSRKSFRLDYIELDEISDLNELIKFVQIYRSHSHPNLLPLLDISLFKSELIIFSSPHYLCDCEELLACEQGKEGLEEHDICYILCSVLRALAYLHNQYIIHRGVQLSSICVTARGHVYLRGLEHSVSQRGPEKVLHGIYDMDEKYTECLCYTSPDILIQGCFGYTVSSDLYSVAVVACELANGVRMFENCSPLQMLYEKLVGLNTPVLWDRVLLQKLSKATCSCEEKFYQNFILKSDVWLKKAKVRKFSTAFHNFLKKCLDSNKKHTATSLVHHQFFTKHQHLKLSANVLLMMQNVYEGKHNCEAKDCETIQRILNEHCELCRSMSSVKISQSGEDDTKVNSEEMRV